MTAPTKKYTVIACEVFRQEFETLALSAQRHIAFRFRFQHFGLHDTPLQLCPHLQDAIDEERDADAILIGYGLCSRGIVGLTARSVPLVLPRAHDCITVFLGSRRRYDEEFRAHSGTYYYSTGWVEQQRSRGSELDLSSPQAQTAREAKLAEYTERYGRDNAAYLVEVESQWIHYYDRAAFIDTLGGADGDREFVREIAYSNGWDYADVEGDVGLIRRFLNGDWDDDFLIVPPGRSVTDTADDRIIRAEELTVFTTT